MLEAEEEDELQEGEDSEIISEQDTGTEELQISVHALTGALSYRTMRIKGKVKKCTFTILIDSGSTHNFLDPVLAKRTGQNIKHINPLTVVVADGTKVFSKAMVEGFKWNMQGAEFEANVRLLPLGGCDMVLGVQWLSTLGPVLWDFKDLRMEFKTKDRKHVLRGSNSVEI